MQQHRIISLASILIMLIIPVIGWFLVAQPQLTAATLADQQRADAVAQAVASQAVVDQLKADSAKLPELEEALNELRTSIPAGVDPSGYIDGLSALAKISDVKITTLTVEDPVAYVPAVAPVDPNASAAETSEDATEGEPTAPVVETQGIVTNPLIDSTNFVAIPVTIEIDGKLSSVLKFVNGLQSNARLFLVSTLSTEPGANSDTVIGKVGGYIYAIPTGVEGNPRPISTIVKSMDPPKDETDEETTTDSESTDSPDPDPTETSAP